MDNSMTDNTQRICETKPFCLCVGEGDENDKYECCCTGNIVGCPADKCVNCGAALVLINTETGERIAA